jgi:hypothetical protein
LQQTVPINTSKFHSDKKFHIYLRSLFVLILTSYVNTHESCFLDKQQYYYEKKKNVNYEFDFRTLISKLIRRKRFMKK